MEELRSLNTLFEKKLFRIPDYQRGYAWQEEQLRDFWEDLINVSDDRSHYTGVLTLKEVSPSEIRENTNEYWLVDDHAYRLYHIVDGQQRLTTVVIFLQAFIDCIKSFPENERLEDKKIYISDSLSIEDIIERFLFKVKPTGNEYRTYKFGYTEDNPSYDYLKYRIFKEAGAGTIDETFYTLNLKNAQTYFFEQLSELYYQEGMSGLKEIYKRLTKQFLFNEYVIKDEFDVFVAFETMNNRGKKLSDLELLKNRLIYLTTLYTGDELDSADRKTLRYHINSAWKEVYHQLGRNEKRPLNDDDFLKAHWILFFKYSRKRGNDYIEYLLKEYFSPKNIHMKVEKEVVLDSPEMVNADFDGIESDEENVELPEEIITIERAALEPVEIKNYVLSLKNCALHWFHSYFPRLSDLNEEVKEALDRLNRIGMGYFRPLVMSILKNVDDDKKIIRNFDVIERFIFIEFRLNQTRRTYRDSEFYNYARELDQRMITIEEIMQRVEELISYNMEEDGSFRIDPFYAYIKKQFESGGRYGYYGWHALRYFLFEYELSLEGNRSRKVFWEDLVKNPRDKVSIEHIFPQTPEKGCWNRTFSNVGKKEYYKYQGSLGNLLLLSQSINSSLQNDGFIEKKRPKYNNEGVKIRNAYLDGSHSEIEVAMETDWTPETIRERGIKLLTFMEKRWDIRFRDQKTKEALLFLE